MAQYSALPSLMQKRCDPGSKAGIGLKVPATAFLKMKYFMRLVKTLALATAFACGGVSDKGLQGNIEVNVPSKMQTDAECVWKTLQERGEPVSTSFREQIFYAGVNDFNSDKKNDLQYIISSIDPRQSYLIPTISFYDYYPLDSLDAIQSLQSNGESRWLIIKPYSIEAYQLLSEAFKSQVCDKLNFWNDVHYEEFQELYQQILRPDQ